MHKIYNGLIDVLPGVMLALLVAVPSWFLGKVYTLVGGPVFAISLGTLLSACYPGLLRVGAERGVAFTTGLKFTSKKLLQYSIVLLGLDMNMHNVISIGRSSLVVVLFSMTAAFAIAYIVGRLLGVKGAAATLIGVGTAICGGSAIAATAPVINAKEEDVVHAVSTIFLFNILAVFIFPIIGRAMSMDDISFGIWAGTAVNDTSSVVATATSWSNSSGNFNALQFATIVKLTRTLMIVPVTLVLAVHTSYKNGRSRSGGFKFTKVFPWFVIFFIMAALINTFTGLSAGLKSAEAGKFVIVMAMASIGLQVNLKSFIANGIKPVLLGLSCWIAVAVAALVAQSFIGI